MSQTFIWRNSKQYFTIKFKEKFDHSKAISNRRGRDFWYIELKRPTCIRQTHFSSYCAPFNFYNIMHEILVTSAFGNNNKNSTVYPFTGSTDFIIFNTNKKLYNRSMPARLILIAFFSQWLWFCMEFSKVLRKHKIPYD